MPSMYAKWLSKYDQSPDPEPHTEGFVVVNGSPSSYDYRVAETP